MSVYPQEDIKIAYTCMKLGKEEEAQQFLSSYKAFMDQDRTLYKNMNACLYYCALGDMNEAMNQLKLFSEEHNFHYWTILFMPVDPLMSDLRKEKEYPKIYKKLERNFQSFHDRIEKNLSEKGLIEAN